MYENILLWVYQKNKESRTQRTLCLPSLLAILSTFQNNIFIQSYRKPSLIPSYLYSMKTSISWSWFSHFILGWEKGEFCCFEMPTLILLELYCVLLSFIQWCGIPGIRRQRLWLILEMMSTNICYVWRLLLLRDLSRWNLERSGEGGRSFQLFLPVTVVGNLILERFSREVERFSTLAYILYRYILRIQTSDHTCGTGLWYH